MCHAVLLIRNATCKCVLTVMFPSEIVMLLHVHIAVCASLLCVLKACTKLGLDKVTFIALIDYLNVSVLPA